jgi:hypothetical protein
MAKPAMGRSAVGKPAGYGSMPKGRGLLTAEAKVKAAAKGNRVLGKGK